VASKSVTVIDGATNGTTTVPVGTDPYSVAVNPVTNMIYVANDASDNVTVIDGSNNSTTTVAAGDVPLSVAVNPVTNKIYVANEGSNNVTVIDGATNATTTVPAGTRPWSVALNPVTNMIYVANEGASLTVIDGATNSTTTVALGSSPWSVAVNAVTNQIYVANAGSANVTVIDGVTNSTTTVAAGSTPESVAVNPVTNMIYVANHNSNNVTVIDEQQVQPVPLTTSITPLANNQTNNPTPSFTFSANSTMATTPGNVFFQVDTWQNAWSTATGSNPSYAGTVASLQPGFHILYAYAGDSQEASSDRSPLTGAIQAYGFLVTPVPSVVTVTPNPATGLTNTFALTYSDTGGYASLYSVGVIFDSAVTPFNTCFLVYYPSNNTLYLYNNNAATGTTWIKPGSGTLSNSQCTITGSGTSVVKSGNNLTLNLEVTASSTYTGTQNIFVKANDNDGSTTGWLNEGTWTP
jgi:YVTN family beta-propeller protein